MLSIWEAMHSRTFTSRWVQQQQQQKKSATPVINKQSFNWCLTAQRPKNNYPACLAGTDQFSLTQSGLDEFDPFRRECRQLSPHSFSTGAAAGRLFIPEAHRAPAAIQSCPLTIQSLCAIGWPLNRHLIYSSDTLKSGAFWTAPWTTL